MVRKTIYKTKRYKRWRTKVFKRDRYKCQMCEKVGGYIEAHHIKLKSIYPELMLKINNGITLCGGCHKEMHKEDQQHRDWEEVFSKLAKKNKAKPRIRRIKRRRI